MSKATKAPTRLHYGDSFPTPHAAQVCADCGALGCLIPVPHKVVTQ
jgi:hypothetical protein